ncbi:MAG TPA: tetratricopeptide repeat protein [Candidatus Omnitrophota bacterium]|nr:tetratricopeptide repeat protein [Candidatus Omnitrophota bacterium]HPB67586.1 tetratricopeptide repeat protein [Candidatus Omnitrophota bacterium]HQO57840.1 tetratricopeptide repeat protein [Candidatus Omnitrophota bacterium]HQP11856.1 tetratricopeptide repeat protein [Candidatus Omnitrophota bacterium]
MRHIFFKNLKWIADDPLRALVVCLLLTFLAYSNSLAHDFIIDDFSFIVDWPLIQDLRNFPEFFGPHNQPPGEEGVYSPLKTLMHALNYALWGTDPLGHHLVAIFVLLLSTFYVYRLSFLVTANRLIAFLSAVFFGLHPIHTETAATKTGSVDTTGVLFLFIAFFYYLRARQACTPQTGPASFLWGNRDYKLALLFSCLSTFLHELCLIIPLLWVLYELAFPLPRDKGRIQHATLRVLPFFIITVIYIAIKFWLLKDISRGDYLGGSFYLTMLVILKVQVKNCLIMFFPFTLAVKHVISKGIFAVDVWDFDQQAVLQQSILDPQVISSILFLGLIAAATVWAYKNNRLIFFCIGWFYISVLPAANIVPIESFFAERYLYPGSWAFCLLIAYGVFLGLDPEKTAPVPIFGRMMPRGQVQNTAIALLLIITTFYFVRTFLRNRDWRTQLTFFQAEVRANPQSADLFNGLGKAYLQDGQPHKAIEAFQRAVAIQPEMPLYYFSLAEAYTAQKKFPQAEKILLQAIHLAPKYAEAYFNLAIIKILQGDMKSAEDYAARSFNLLLEQGRWEDSQQYRKAFYDFSYQNFIADPGSKEDAS